MLPDSNERSLVERFGHATVSTPSTQYVTGIAVDKIASGALGRIEIAPSFNAGV